MPETPFDCSKCGKTHPRGCRGHKASNPDEPCRRAPMNGQSVCPTHGGRSPQAMAAADRRIETSRQQKALILEIERLGDDVLPDTDPLVGIMKSVTVSALMVDYLRAEMSKLEAVFEGDKPHVLTDLLRLWTKELARASKAALDVGVKEQQLRIFAQQVQLLADVIRKLFDDPELGLSPQQREAANHVIGRHLRALDDVA